MPTILVVFIAGLFAAAPTSQPDWEADLAAKDAACHAGEDKACMEWSFALNEAKRAGAITDARAQEMALAACEAGNAYGCSFASIPYRYADLEKHRELMTRACALSRERIVGIVCWELGNLLVTTEPQDLTTARWAYGRGCELENGCFEYGVMLRDGLGGEASDSQALEAFLKQCAVNGEDACHAAAAMIGTGRGAPEDADRAAELHMKACAIATERAGNVEEYCPS